MDRKVRGMTLIELVIVIAIISILMGFAFVWLRNLVLYQRLKADTDRFMTYLNTARLYSMTGRNQTAWGIAIIGDMDTVVLFRDENSNCKYDPGEGVRNFTLQTVRVERVSCAQGNSIVFDRKGYPNRAPCVFYGCTYSLKSRYATYQRNVVIDVVGRIRYETP